MLSHSFIHSTNIYCVQQILLSIVDPTLGPGNLAGNGILNIVILFFAHPCACSLFQGLCLFLDNSVGFSLISFSFCSKVMSSKMPTLSIHSPHIRHLCLSSYSAFIFIHWSCYWNSVAYFSVFPYYNVTSWIHTLYGLC